MTRRVYLDNNATTPVDPLVLAAMMPYFTEKFGNAASRNHSFGWEAEEAVKKAREQIAAVIAADARGIVFTSGATEGNNTVIKGVPEMYADRGRHIITQVTEHKAVIDPCNYLAQRGYRVTFLGVDKFGRIDLEELKDAICDDTILVSIMHGNNEIGTLQPIGEIGRICKAREVFFHTDACQTFGKVPIDVQAMEIDLLTLSGHKIYGPKGVGAIYYRRKRPRVRWAPLLHGGGHEENRRSGTLNVPGIVGLGKAAELCQQQIESESARLVALRDRLRDRIVSQLDQVFLNGHPSERTPTNLNLSFAYVEGESLMMSFKDVAVSSGSACTSASLEPSYVLRALGVGEDLAHSSIRFSVGRFNTEAEIDYAAGRVVAAVKKLREMSPLYEMAQQGLDPSKVAWAKN
ncbi:MAG: IscS subfamily cysteine desulfurase [Phycisphaerae bacterium]